MSDVVYVRQACVCGVVPDCRACNGTGRVLKPTNAPEFSVALDEDAEAWSAEHAVSLATSRARTQVASRRGEYWICAKCASSDCNGERHKSELGFEGFLWKGEAKDLKADLDAAVRVIEELREIFSTTGADLHVHPGKACWCYDDSDGTCLCPDICSRGNAFLAGIKP